MAKAKAKSNRIPAVPTDLTTAIQTGKCAVFVGAGLSTAAGYPGWGKLLENLIDKSLLRKWGKITTKDAKNLKELTKEGDKLLLVAEELREIMGDNFERELVATFSVDRAPTATHRRIMSIPFSMAVTTNYDLLLEEAYLQKFKKLPRAFTNLQPPEIAAAIWRDEYFILKAHGDVNNRASLVITERDYRNVIFRSHGYRSALASIFTGNTVLFLGVSFGDPELKLLLSYLHDAFHSGGTMHYALVPKSRHPALPEPHGLCIHFDCDAAFACDKDRAIRKMDGLFFADRFIVRRFQIANELNILLKVEEPLK